MSAAEQSVVVEGYDQRAADFVNSDIGLAGHLGLVITYISPDRVEAHMECDERHQQPMGIVNGGAWCTAIETVASIAAALRVARDGRTAVGVTNTTDFLRAHRTGRVDIVGTPIHAGRSQQLWQVIISRASDGKAVARGQVRVQAIERDQQLAGQRADPTGSPS